jgi:uncharacterized protein (TIGR02594 family)
VKLTLFHCARLALATSALALALPLAQSEARPLKSSRTHATAIALPFGGDVTDVSARRRHRHVRHVAKKKSSSHYASYSRRARTARAAAVSAAPLGYAAAGLSDAGYGVADGAYAASQSNTARQYTSQQVAYASRSRRGRNAPVPASTVYGSSSVVSEARRYLGGNPTGRSRAWCAAFMNMVLQRTGHGGSGSNLARSFANYGHRVSGPQVGAIAVMSRRGGGHVGVVSGIDAKGNPIVISGNHGRRVAESVYSRGRIYAYVMP